jgi:SAM-dependent methyltransferase
METTYPQSVWDEEHQRDRFEEAHPDDQIRVWMDSHIRGLPIRGGRALEIGCFPGRYLAYLGRAGFEVNGVDLTPRVPEMREWLVREGVRVGRVEMGDFFAFQDPTGFDLVLSSGFIEHFEDWKRCLDRHIDLIKPGGYLFLSAPNFVGGLQNFLHRNFDRENFDRHHLPAMDLAEWRKVAQARGLEIVETRWFDRFDFWNGPQKRPAWQKAVTRGVTALAPTLAKLLPRGSRWSAPYCGMVARRPS